MMDIKEGRAIIKTAIEKSLIEMLSGKIVPMNLDVITEHVMLNWSDTVFGPSAEIALFGLHDTVHDEVRKRINKEKASEQGEDDIIQCELVMEGYEHLQKVYVIDNAILPIESMSDDQLLAKAEEHDRLAIGNANHAKEIRRYVEERHQSVAV